MKKIKVLVVAAIATLTMAIVMAFAGCGAASIEGFYCKDATINSGSSESYKLELYNDGTYRLTYRQWFALGPSLGLTYGRDVTSYGDYTVTAEDAEMSQTTVHLNMPERMQLVAFHRNATLVTADTSAWPEANEAEGIEGGISYTLMERAETETWATAEEFIAAYGREYDMVCDDAAGGLQVTVIGTQIPVTSAVTAPAAAE